MGTETQYLKECFGECLVEGLAQVAERQPADPINFLACWLYRHNRNLNEEKKRKTERAQLEQEREEALAELERIEKLKAEELQMAQKYEEQQKAFSERYPEIVNLPEKSGAPNLPTVDEIDESHFSDKRTEEEDGNLPEENEMPEFKQEMMEDMLDQGELNTARNELDEMLQGINISESLQEDLYHISDDEGKDQLEHSEPSDNEHDIQTRVDSPDEELKSSNDLNSE